MKNPLKKKPVDGSKAIKNAIGRFAAIVAEIETGIAANVEKIAANKQVMDGLESENTFLSVDASYGQTVAQRLRELIA